MLDWLLPNINRKLDQIMATLEGLTAAVHNNTAATGALVTTVNGAVVELRRLGDLLADGGAVTQEDLDALASELSGSTDEVTGTSARLQSVVDEEPENPPV